MLISDPSHLPDEEKLRVELELLRNSREFRLGSRLRQSRIFTLLRSWRLRNKRVHIQALPAANGLVRLLGVWYDEYPQGMPVELLEYDRHTWRVENDLRAPFGGSLSAHQPAKLAVYTQDENLRLDFETDPGGGQLRLITPKGERVLSLSAAVPGVVSIYPNLRQAEVFSRPGDAEKLVDQGALQSSIAQADGQGPRARFAPTDQAWIEQQQRSSQPLSLNHPEWRGILASARELFNSVYTIPDDLDRPQAEYYARLFREAGVPSITIQGFPRSYVHLVKAMRKIAPQISIYVIYHGNFLHMREDYDWRVFRLILDLHAQGEIAKIGFVKQGMAEIMSKAGVKSGFILNMVGRIPEGPSQPLPGGPHVGIWGQPDWSWKKSPYAMLAALKLVPGAYGHAINVSPRLKEFGDSLGIQAEYRMNALPQDQALAALAQMHVNLYITLTECAPMMPLESLSMGAPCLFGPTSHYFLDHPYLHERLVVPYPDNAENIARYTVRALEERDEIIRAYCSYAPAYNQRALQALSDFLEHPIRPATAVSASDEAA